MTLKEAIVAAFQTLESIVARYPKGDLEARAMRAWLAVMQANHVTPKELETAVFKFLERPGPFMPTPGEVLALVKRENPCSLILGPVKTGEFGGVVEIGSRERCEALGLPYVELEEAKPALPGGRERLERSLNKLARERSAFDETPDPEAVERQRAMVEAVREAPR